MAHAKLKKFGLLFSAAVLLAGNGFVYGMNNYDFEVHGDSGENLRKQALQHAFLQGEKKYAAEQGYNCNRTLFEKAFPFIKSILLNILVPVGGSFFTDMYIKTKKKYSPEESFSNAYTMLNQLEGLKDDPKAYRAKRKCMVEELKKIKNVHNITAFIDSGSEIKLPNGTVISQKESINFNVFIKISKKNLDDPLLTKHFEELVFAPYEGRSPKTFDVTEKKYLEEKSEELDEEIENIPVLSALQNL